MKLAQGLESQDEPPSWPEIELVFPPAPFFKQSLIYGFISCRRTGGFSEWHGRTTGSPRWAGNPVIYLEWKSCNGIVSSLVVHPSGRAGGEKVKFE